MTIFDHSSTAAPGIIFNTVLVHRLRGDRDPGLLVAEEVEPAAAVFGALACVTFHYQFAGPAGMATDHCVGHHQRICRPVTQPARPAPRASR